MTNALLSMISLQSELGLELFRHDSETTVMEFSKRVFPSGRYEEEESGRLDSAIRTGWHLFPGQRLVLSFKNCTLTSHAVTHLEEGLRWLAAQHIPVCVVSMGVQPEFVRHRLMIVAPIYAETVLEGIIKLLLEENKKAA
jgi:hypothetical protein